MSGDKSEVILKDFASMLQSCGELIHKYADKEKRDQLASLRNMALNMYNSHHEHENNVAALNSTKQHFEDDSDNISNDVDEVYRKCIDQVHSVQISFEEHPTWSPVHKVLKKRDEEHGDTNASVTISQCSGASIDPLTKKLIEQPCKNRVCGHVYEYKSIMEYLKGNKKRVNCPYVGCGNFRLRSSDICRDENLETESVLSGQYSVD